MSKILKDTEAAYAAGIFDGEGSVYVSSGRALANGEKQFFLCVSINNTNEEMIRLMQNWFGGSISRTAETGNRKGLWRLRMYSRVARNFLTTVRPYLTIKHRQADLAIEFQNGIEKGALTEAMKLELKTSISAFNQKGIRLKA